MPRETASFTAKRRRPNGWIIALIVLIHIGLFYFLARFLAPSTVEGVERSVVSAFTVTVTAPPEEPPPPPPEAPEPDEGAQGDPGREAVPAPTAAPTPRIPIRRDPPAPRASSTGTATNSGATDAGEGTGAAGQGKGTGSGNSGSGQGNGDAIATQPRLVRSITDASAFPVPPGGREARIGQSVIVRLMVSAEGRVTGCGVYRASPFPETDEVVCRLAREQVTFEPARTVDGRAVAAPFLYRQRFFN